MTASVLNLDAVPAVEVWKPIILPGIADRFVASDQGIIKTLEYDTTGAHNGKPFVRHMPERILKPRINKQSPSLGKHPVVGLYTGNGRARMTHREVRVAKLVATAFYGVPFNPNDMRDVKRWKLRFLDGDILNCTAANLSWVYSAGENGSGGKTQSVYEKHLDGWEAARKQPASEWMARMFGTDQEENAA